MIHPWIASFADLPFELDQWVQGTLPDARRASAAAAAAAERGSMETEDIDEEFRTIRVV